MMCFFQTGVKAFDPEAEYTRGSVTMSRPIAADWYSPCVCWAERRGSGPPQSPVIGRWMESRWMEHKEQELNLPEGDETRWVILCIYKIWQLIKRQFRQKQKFCHRYSPSCRSKPVWYILSNVLKFFVCLMIMKVNGNQNRLVTKMSFMFNRRKKTIQIWNDMRVSNDDRIFILVWTWLTNLLVSGQVEMTINCICLIK